MTLTNFPFSGGGRRERLSTAEYLKYGGLGLLFLLLIVLYVFEFDYFNRSLGIRPLIIGSLIIGVILGVLAGRRYQPSTSDLTDKVQVYVFFIFVLALFAPLFGSLSNRLLSFRPVQLETAEFVKEEPYFSSRFGVLEGEQVLPSGYYLFFYKDQRLYRIENEQAWFPEAKQGDAVELPVAKGLWGVEYVPKQ